MTAPRRHNAAMDHDLVSHFRVHERIGSGGMGTVYRAVDTRLGREVALKFLSEGISDDPTARERFLREAHAAAALDHPNICTIYEVGEGDDGRAFIAMAYYRGETLGRRLARGALPVEEAVELARQLASGLQRAHANGVVHRDLKPANVFVTSEGLLKILDFGLARSVSDASLTRSGILVGTAGYLAPEQVLSQTADFRADLWSFGVVLFQMLAGRLPFGGQSDAQLMFAIAHQEPLELRRARPGLPEPLYAVVGHCLEKDPGRRCPSAAALLRELELARDSVAGWEDATQNALPSAFPASAQAAETLAPAPPPAAGAQPRTPAAGPTATPPPIATSAPVVGRRWRSELALALAALVVLTLVLVWALHREPHAATAAEGGPRTVAVLPIANVSGRADLDGVAEGIGAVLTGQLASLPGVRVVARDEAWAARRRLASASVREVADELGVDAVLEGQLLAEPGKLRVQLSLVDAADGLIRWSRGVEGAEGKLLALQDDLAREIGEGLVGSLERVPAERLARPTTSEEAYRLFLRAEAESDRTDIAGKLDELEALLRRALAADPSFALAHARLAQVLAARFEVSRDAGVLADAKAHAAKASELAPELPDGPIAEAEALAANNEHEKAAAILEPLARRFPEVDRIAFLLATSYKLMGKPSVAEATIRRALQARPNYWRGWNVLGQILLEQGDHAGAREALRRAAALTKLDSGIPYENLATLELSSGNFAAALEAYDRLPRPISDPELASNIGTTYFFLGDLAEAERHYRLAVRLKPSSAAFHANLGDVLAKERKLDAARDEYGAAADAMTAESQGRQLSAADAVMRALYLGKAGRCGESATLTVTLTKTTELNASNAATLAKGYAACGNRARALDLLEHALDLGYKRELARGQEEFQPLANDPRFRALTAPGKPS